MNDNEALGDLGIPIWAEAIVDRHNLGLRADSPLSAATVLLTDAAVDLKGIAAVVFQEQAITPDTLRLAESCLAMLNDAIELARLCPNEPENGTVSESEDGKLTWSPAL